MKTPSANTRNRGKTYVVGIVIFMYSSSYLFQYFISVKKVLKFCLHFQLTCLSAFFIFIFG